MTKLARLIAQEEGFGIPGAIPTTHHNPGDLRHSPHSVHSGDPNAIGQIGSDAEGWADLERQLQLYAKRGLSLAELVMAYAPPNENDTSRYTQFLCDGLGLAPSDTVATALEQA